MKSLILLLALITLTCQAQSTPAYLKDATITVKLKGGKEYTYSANEYAVIKRNSKPKIELAQASEPIKVESSRPAQAPEPKRHKHIVSGEIVRSNGSLNTSTGANDVEVENQKEIGVGIQYQNNIYKDLYLGGRVDTNGGTGVQIGVGF